MRLHSVHCKLRAAAALLTALLALTPPAGPSHAQDSEQGDELFAGEELDDEDLFGDEDLDADDDLFGDSADAPAPGEAPRPEDATEDRARPGDAGSGEASEATGAAESEARASTRDAPGEAGPGPGDLDPLTPGPSGDIEELIIQGQASGGIEVDTTTSTTVFDPGDLQAMGVEDISDVAQFTPNLEIRQAGSTTATFFIRGVGLNDFTANASGAVAIYQDDVALNLPPLQLGQVFDVENLAVERGPQGTGAGRNATAGAIKLYARKPTGEFGGFVRADYGNFNFFEVEGALEVPLLHDIVSSRAAFIVRGRDGIIENRCGGISQAEIDRTGGVNLCGNFQPIRANLEEELNDKNAWAARAMLRFVPPELEMDWLINVHGSRIDQTGVAGQHLGTQEGSLGTTDILGYRQPEIAAELAQIAARGPTAPTRPECNRSADPAACFALRDEILAARDAQLAQRLSDRPLDRQPFAGDYNEPGYERMHTVGGFLRGVWELERLSLTSLSGFERYDRQRFIDADYSPNRLFEFDIEDDAWQFTQDLRAEGELDRTPLEWGVGAYYLQEELDFLQLTLPGGDIRSLRQEFVQKTWSVGVYGELNWEILDDLYLEGGARWNWEKKTFDVDVVRALRRGCVQQPSGLIPKCSDERTFAAPTGSIKLRYLFDDENSVYWKYTRGWKGAQFNVRDANPATDVIDVATPETIDAFEIGVSNVWFDGRLSLEGALFWYSYEDYQVFQFTNDVESPPQRVVLNANDALLYGAELDFVVNPIEPLTFDLRFGWLESKFLNFTDTGTRRVASNIPGEAFFFEQVIDYNGNRLPNTPRFKLSATAEYVLELGRFGSLLPRYDVTWTDKIAFDPSEGRGAPNVVGRSFLPRFAIGQKAYWTHSMRVAWRSPDGNLEIAGWVRNLSNEVYKTLAFDGTSAVNLVGNLVGDPRTYGASIRLQF